MIVLICLVAVGAFVKVWRLKEAVPEASSRELPKIEISLNDTTMKEIHENGKDVKYLNNYLNVTADDRTTSFLDVEIKGRGNGTWGHDKIPLQFELKSKANLLGLGERRKWILLANYMDGTNLRTDTAFYLEKMLDEEFAYSGEFVELYVNGNYEGLYYLTRGIEIRKNAVDLRDPFGLLVELDNIYCKRENLYYLTNNGECLTVKDTVAKDNLEEAMMGFLESFNSLEEAIRVRDYSKIVELIDLESFVQYYLISEFAINIDAYFTSQYFYKDGVEDKIHAGPAWDFDIAFDNYRITGNKPADSELTSPINAEEYLDRDDQIGNWSRLFARLLEFPEFREEVEHMFQARLAGRKIELLSHVSRQAAKIYESAVRDSKRWEKENYVKEIKELLNWLSTRYDYFEKEYGTKKHKNLPFYDINVLEV